MTDQSELNSRAALCRKLAQREPANRTFWMAEAENWSRLSKEKPHGEDSRKDRFRNSGALSRAIGQIPVDPGVATLREAPCTCGPVGDDATLLSDLLLTPSGQRNPLT